MSWTNWLLVGSAAYFTLAILVGKFLSNTGD
jgi:hypothetical protein